MNAKSIHKPLFVSLVAVVLLAALGMVNKFGSPAKADNVLDLQAPSFVNPTGMKESNLLSPASFLEDEAGISAYTHVSGPIDLSVVRDEFRTIEQETSQYIIGSVGIPDYSDNYDPHVYVHTDGWVVAYYLAADPSSIIVDLRHYDGVEISTMLENAIEQILTVVGVVTFDLDYYDFRYPNATNIMLITEAIDGGGDDSFEVKLPSDFTYYERAWSHALRDTGGCSGLTYSTLYVNDVSINDLSVKNSWALAHEELSVGQLPPGVFHTIKVDLSGCSNGRWACGSIALIYQEVP